MSTDSKFTDCLCQKYASIYEKATVHPFIKSCKDGSIKPSQFNTWLVQDYLYVKYFVRFAGSTLSKAPDGHILVILSGISALGDELQWFERKATERSLSYTVDPQATCRQYQELMEDLKEESYPVLAISFWAIEEAYNVAWKSEGQLPPPYTEFGNRWGHPNFTKYVDELRRQADEAMAGATDAEKQLAEEYFVKIMKLEVDFWNMAFNEA